MFLHLILDITMINLQASWPQGRKASPYSCASALDFLYLLADGSRLNWLLLGWMMSYSVQLALHRHLTNIAEAQQMCTSWVQRGYNLVLQICSCTLPVCIVSSQDSHLCFFFFYFFKINTRAWNLLALWSESFLCLLKIVNTKRRFQWGSFFPDANFKYEGWMI